MAWIELPILDERILNPTPIKMYFNTKYMTQISSISNNRSQVWFHHGTDMGFILDMPAKDVVSIIDMAES